jgi:NADH-quinone oxidoreductase subunit L
VGAYLSTLYLIAWLLPLVSFVAIALFGPRMGRLGRGAGFVATGAILAGVVLSLMGLAAWVGEHGLSAGGHHGDAQHAAADHHDADHKGDAGHHDGHDTDHGADHAGADHDGQGHHDDEHDHNDDHAHAATGKTAYHGDWYTLAEFGNLRLTIGYYVDALTVVMFCMVTIIATCIHFYAMGYMHDELVEDYEDHEITTPGGGHYHRRGRYHRFFQYFSLFCFSMLGIVISGNVAMTFVFWELVGICSYFLIGFYFERHSASTAANKAFIVNRIGDFGMIIGMMALFGALGTFDFGGDNGIFAQVRPQEYAGATGTVANNYQLIVPDGMVQAGAGQQVETIVNEHIAQPAGMEAAKSEIASQTDTWRLEGYGHALLVVAGLGIFCGCVGKSAQFPLHTWLPDAMEGPTPVSALVHSATMVAAGVFLAARFYPVFTPVVLLVIAVMGCITLFMAATIAITATDIKRVLAYSTLSQLGYMMFALGVGGWVAGVLHLITHAFFKSLLFLCSGSVIHAVHSNEMTDMGGLRRKMPITAYTMLVGCLAIIGAGIPLVVGLSGYYSKDAILAQALSFGNENGAWKVMFYIAAGGAAITAFYMFRLWFMTFVGQPRDQHRYDHAHESPAVMWVPLVILAVFAIFVATPHPFTLTEITTSPLMQLLEQAVPNGVAAGMAGSGVVHPAEHASHAPEIHVQAGLIAAVTAASGLLLACCIYWWRLIDPAEVRNMFAPIYSFLRNKWWFDEIYDVLFVQPTLLLGRIIAGFDRRVIDWLIDNAAGLTRWFSGGFDRWIDRTFVDGLVNWIAARTYAIGLALRNVQTGQIRQYVVLIVVGAVALFLLTTLGISQ